MPPAPAVTGGLQLAPPAYIVWQKVFYLRSDLPP